MAEVETSVLIVGGGPVGLAMALELGVRGVDCLVVEQGDGKAPLPRASGLTPRSMEFCRRWGIEQEIYHGGFPLDVQLDSVFCTTMSGFELDRVRMPALGERPGLSYSPVNAHRFPQNLLDPLLTRAAARQAGVQIEHTTKLVGFEEGPDGVLAYVQPLPERATYDFNEDGAALLRSSKALDVPGAYTVRAHYMVACDGVMSPVRDALGIGVEGATGGGDPVLGYALSALVRLPDFKDRHKHGEAERYFFLDQQGIWGNLTTVDGRDRWRLTIIGNAAKMDLANLDMEEHLRRCLGSPDIPFEIEIVTPWRRRQQVAKALSRGRVFLAGDAAHAMSPTGGLGLNTGLGDVINLGWKLEATLKGWGGPHLLASYEAERGPVAYRNTAAAAANYKRYDMPIDYSRILEDSAEAQNVRKAIGAAVRDELQNMINNEGAGMGYRYEKSPIIVPDGAAAPPDDLVVYRPVARPGAAAPHAWLKDGRSILDLFGTGFTLLRFDDNADPNEPALQAAAREVGLPLALEVICEPAVAAQYAHRLTLVRPDAHVAWHGEALPQPVADLIGLVRGASVGPKPAAVTDRHCGIGATQDAILDPSGRHASDFR